jgi:chromosome segregation ATPase
MSDADKKFRIVNDYTTIDSPPAVTELMRKWARELDAKDAELTEAREEIRLLSETHAPRSVVGPTREELIKQVANLEAGKRWALGERDRAERDHTSLAQHHNNMMADKDESIQKVCAESIRNNETCNDLRAQLAALQADRDRLEWLIQNATMEAPGFYAPREPRSPYFKETHRDMIDRCMKSRP